MFGSQIMNFNIGGIDIIAKVIRVMNKNTVIVKDSLIVMKVIEDGELCYRFRPWMMYDISQELNSQVINLKTCYAMTEPSKDIIEKYISCINMVKSSLEEDLEEKEEDRMVDLNNSILDSDGNLDSDLTHFVQHKFIN